MKIQHQFIFFILIGSLSALVNFGIFFLLWRFTDFHYLFSVSLAYFLAVIVHFCGNRSFTFKARHQKIHFQLFKYTSLLAINYLMTLAIVSLSTEHFHFSPFFGVIVANLCTVIIGFTLSRSWIFYDKSQTHSPPNK